MCHVLSKRVMKCSGGLVGLLVLLFVLAPSAATAAPRWCSPFEMEAAAPVTDGQPADAIDNAVGLPGKAAGSDSELQTILYLAHGQFSPVIPAEIDPAGQAGGFVASLPDDRGTGINTNVPSNVTDHITMEGYFYMGSSEIVLAPTFVGRRLATQKRSNLDDNSRLAIGIHASRTGVVDGLFDYEGFNYTGTALEGQSGGVGFSGPWTNAAAFAHLSDDGVSLTTAASPFTPVGSRISGSGGTSGRPLRKPVDMAVDGVTYLTALMRKTSTAATTADNLEIGLATSATVGGTSSTIRIGMTTPDQFFLTASNAPQGTVVAGETYLVLVKIVSSATGSDTSYMNVYGPGDTLPEAEPETWTFTHSLNSTALLTHLRLTIGANCNKGEVDEIRIGTTYASVSDPDAPLGDEGEVVNLLATYYAEEVPAEPPALPTYINHLEFGTTPLVASTWYHFALTYDGAALRWYLNGQQEGEVLAPPIAPSGSAKMVLANNRMSGTNDRGFYGLIDEIRIWNKAIAPSEMVVNGGAPGDGLLWRSRFETQFGVPVTPGLAADQMNCFDNSVGPPHGSPAGIVTSVYRAYGQTGVPAVPRPSIQPV